jgi:DNA-binding CsgD family transcriptional regulator
MSASDLYGSPLLSPRQRQVIELVAPGRKNSEMAKIIGTTDMS